MMSLPFINVYFWWCLIHCCVSLDKFCRLFMYLRLFERGSHRKKLIISHFVDTGDVFLLSLPTLTFWENWHKLSNYWQLWCWCWWCDIECPILQNTNSITHSLLNSHNLCLAASLNKDILICSAICMSQ